MNYFAFFQNNDRKIKFLSTLKGSEWDPIKKSRLEYEGFMYLPYKFKEKQKSA